MENRKYDGGYGAIDNIVIILMLKIFDEKKMRAFLEKDNPKKYKEFLEFEKKIH